MDEIVQQVAQRAGIPEDKARMAVQAVMDQMEKRLPGPLAAQLRSHLTGEGTGGAGGLSGITKGLGEMFGK
ncbi:hypothetical protein BH23GEM8_BH23GEM8_01400 [soil metagenome]